MKIIGSLDYYIIWNSTRNPNLYWVTHTNVLLK